MSPSKTAGGRNTGDDIFVCVGRDKGLKGKIICAVTDSEVSHSWIEYSSSTWGGRWVAHATSRGVIMEYAHYVRERYPTYKIYQCHADLNQGLIAARELIGRSDYDYGVLWNCTLYLLYRATKWEQLRKLAAYNASKMTCSEFVALVLKEAGIDGTGGAEFDPELMTTGMLEAFLDESSQFELVKAQTWTG